MRTTVRIKAQIDVGRTNLSSERENVLEAPSGLIEVVVVRCRSTSVHLANRQPSFYVAPNPSLDVEMSQREKATDQEIDGTTSSEESSDGHDALSISDVSASGRFVVIHGCRAGSEMGDVERRLNDGGVVEILRGQKGVSVGWPERERENAGWIRLIPTHVNSRLDDGDLERWVGAGESPSNHTARGTAWKVPVSAQTGITRSRRRRTSYNDDIDFIGRHCLFARDVNKEESRLAGKSET